MRVAVSGSTGLVGSALCSHLTAQGHEIVRLVRKKNTSVDQCYWNWETGEIESQKLEDLDSCIHLAGENIASRRWSSKQKKLIRDSRVKGTQLLADAVMKLERPPTSFICASATGFYGSQGEQMLTEDSPAGDDFLAKVCLEWEATTQTVQESSNIRVVSLRTGVVLDPAGGALKKMLLPFKLGLGGIIADGSQYISWIGNSDLIKVVSYILENDALRGPINLVAPKAVTNREFTRTLGKVLKRPTCIPLPALVVKLIFGEMGEATLLSSTRVKPERLLNAGFEFTNPTLESTLRALNL